MSRFWSSIVGSLAPYVPGEQPRVAGLVKLNTNESPYGPSPLALAAIREATTDDLRLYPDPASSALRAAIGARFGLSEREVFVGNGSDEVLAHAFQALLKHDAPLLLPDITYAFYATYCRLYGVDAEEVPLDGAYGVRIADYRRPCGAIILANPNAPTGIALPLAGIRQLLEEHADKVVVIDEAYVDFGAESAAILVAEHANLLVVQTFSKSRGLAGLRVGFALGHRDLIEGLERVKDSFNSYPLDRLAQAGALAAWNDRDWFEAQTGRVIETRERLRAELSELGFEVLPSSANFLMARHPAFPGAALARSLRERAILVRHFAKPRIGNHLRISVGTDAECERLVLALREIVGSTTP